MAAFRYTLELSPRYPQAHAELGRASLELGRTDDAIAHIREAIGLSPTDNGLYICCLWAGMAAVHPGEYHAALGWLRTSRQANHAFDNTLIWLALAHADEAEASRDDRTIRVVDEADAVVFDFDLQTIR